MLKMVLADDEVIVRDGLREIITWEEYGIEIIGEAADGQEAVDLCLELSPDILFTDIRMPFLDGLEVASILKERRKELKVIIFSGIQDFGYAKSALNINAEGYILKPLDVSELIAVVRKVIAKISAERNMAEKINKLKEQLNENFGAAREKFLHNVLLGINKKEADIREKLVYFKQPFNADAPMVVAILEIDEYSKTIANYSEEEKQLLSFSVTSVVEELLNSYCRGFCILMNDNEYGMLFNEEEPPSPQTDTDIFAELVKTLEAFLHVSASIGVGRMVHSVLAIHSAYKDAVNALHFKFYTGKGSIINISDIRPNLEKPEYPDLYEEQNQLVHLIRAGNVQETEQALQNLFASFRSDQRYTIEYIQRIGIELIYVVSRALYEIGEDIGAIAGKRPAILDTLYKTEHLFELQQQLNDFMLSIANDFAKKYAQKNGKTIRDIKNIIETQYMEELSVNKIAEAVYLSPNYMSLVFKRETGETISDYLTRKRMDVAKELLQKTDSKILDIANMVGFQDASYFSKVFKKHTGVHPQKYRTLNERVV